MTTFTYDSFNRRPTRTLPSAVDADGNPLPTATEFSFYDALGRLRAQSDFAGNLTITSYDALGRTSAQTSFALASVNSILTIPAGQNWYTSITTTAGLQPLLALADDPANPNFGVRIATTSYDDLGHPTTITHTQDFDLDGTIEADETRVTTQAFDDQNHLTEVTTPEGTIHYAFNDLGQQTDTWTSTSGAADSAAASTTWTHYDYDQLGRLLDVIARRINGQSVSLQTDYAYAATGQLTHQTSANATTSDWSFDASGRLVQLAHKSSTETLATFRYTLNAVGQRTHVEESGPAVFGGSRSVDYDYDAINRLTQEIRTEADDSTTTTNYYFDLVGNRLRQVINGVTTSYTYNDRDELLSETTASVTTKSYYDANGSLTQTKQGDTVTAEFRYDLRNKMIQAAINGVTIKYTYDHDGLRVVRDVDGGRETYLPDLQNPTGYSQTLQIARNGSPVQSFVIGRSIVAQADGSTMCYLLSDQLGSTKALLDATGQPITGQLLAYDAFGTVISGQSTILTPVQFAQQLVDSTTKLSFNRTRWYDLTGRWTQIDPRLAPIGDIANFNGQLYCSADPIHRVDPQGLATASMAVGGFLGDLLVSVGLRLWAIAPYVCAVGIAGIGAYMLAGHIGTAAVAQNLFADWMTSGEPALVAAGTLLAQNTQAVADAMNNALSKAVHARERAFCRTC